jgi:hypothetical protein
MRLRAIARPRAKLTENTWRRPRSRLGGRLETALSNACSALCGRCALLQPDFFFGDVGQPLERRRQPVATDPGRQRVLDEACTSPISRLSNARARDNKTGSRKLRLQLHRRMMSVWSLPQPAGRASFGTGLARRRRRAPRQVVESARGSAGAVMSGRLQTKRRKTMADSGRCGPPPTARRWPPVFLICPLGRISGAFRSFRPESA